MLGYVTAYKPELRMREYEKYKSYYCGICRNVGERLGQLPRFALSYDFAFLALLLASLDEDDEKTELRHCMIHPVKKIPVTYESWAIDYASDMMVLLIYYNFLDDKQDEHRLRGTLGSMLLKSKAASLEKDYPDVAGVIRESLSKLTELEKEKSDSLDMTGDAFSDIMGEVFSCQHVAEHLGSENARVLRELGRALGRWIYLADALDDLAKDIESGSYNPLIYRFRYDRAKESTDDLKARAMAQTEAVLYACLSDVAKSFELLNIKRNRGLLDNILYLGLGRKSDNLLGKEKGEKDERSV